MSPQAAATCPPSHPALPPAPPLCPRGWSPAPMGMQPASAASAVRSPPDSQVPRGAWGPQPWAGDVQPLCSVCVPAAVGAHQAWAGAGCLCGIMPQCQPRGAEHTAPGAAGEPLGEPCHGTTALQGWDLTGLTWAIPGRSVSGHGDSGAWGMPGSPVPPGTRGPCQAEPEPR